MEPTELVIVMGQQPRQRPPSVIKLAHSAMGALATSDLRRK